MLSELFQLDDSSEEEGNGESLRNGGSEDSYSEDEDEEDDEDESCSYRMSSQPPEDCKAVAVIKSVGELSVPEKYKSISNIRVCLLWLFAFYFSAFYFSAYFTKLDLRTNLFKYVNIN